MLFKYMVSPRSSSRGTGFVKGPPSTWRWSNPGYNQPEIAGVSDSLVLRGSTDEYVDPSSVEFQSEQNPDLSASFAVFRHAGLSEAKSAEAI